MEFCLAHTQLSLSIQLVDNPSGASNLFREIFALKDNCLFKCGQAIDDFMRSIEKFDKIKEDYDIDSDTEFDYELRKWKNKIKEEYGIDSDTEFEDVLRKLKKRQY